MKRFARETVLVGMDVAAAWSVWVDWQPMLSEAGCMAYQLGAVTFLVREYDEAVTFFTTKLGFAVIEATPLGGGKRWVRVAPPGAPGPGLLLARAATQEQQTAVGRQAGGRVFLFLETDDFDRDYRRLREAGVAFLEEPRHEAYGAVAVFSDLYGNKWDLLERRGPR